jgi:hypothetical protein
VSERGKELFDRFLSQRLDHPSLQSAPLATRVSELRDMAEAEEIPLAEITEEVGDLQEAIIEATKASRHEIR